MGIVEVLEVSGCRSPLIIEDLDVYPQLPDATGAPTLNSEEPEMGTTTSEGLREEIETSLGELHQQLPSARVRCWIQPSVDYP